LPQGITAPKIAPTVFGVCYLIMENEIWKDVPSLNGRYQVSNLGVVKSVPYTQFNPLTNGLSNHKGKLLTPHFDKDGYAKVVTSVNCKIKNYYLHRLIAQTFIPNPENKPIVNHKDGNKTNNRIDNLEWATHKENVIHAWSIGLMENNRDAVRMSGRLKTGSNNYMSKKIINISTGVIYDTIKLAAIDNKINYSTLKCFLNTNNHHTNKTNLRYYENI
jgi:hypothetical protein